LLLLGVVAIVTLWTRGYWYVWGAWVWPALDAHYKALCYKDIDPLRDAAVFATAYGAATGVLIAVLVALASNLRWPLVWFALGSLSIALMIVASMRQPLSFIFLLSNAALLAFIAAVGIGAWGGQRLRFRMGITGV
jgi:hypothetical protein